MTCLAAIQADAVQIAQARRLRLKEKRAAIGGEARVAQRPAGLAQRLRGGAWRRGAPQPGQRIQKEAELARVQLAEANDVRAENTRLKALLAMPNDEAKPVALARLIASTSGSTRRFATLSRGRDAGITVGMPVRSPMGLVGRVLEVANRSARVLLITDSESMVPVRRARDGIDAFAQGTGDGRLQLRLINLGPNPLKRGDVMVTSGSGGLYRPGIAVAVVSELTRDGAFATVLSDPSSSEFVAVELPFAASLNMPAPSAANANGQAAAGVRR